MVVQYDNYHDPRTAPSNDAHKPTRELMNTQIGRLHASLQRIHSMSISPNLLPEIPPEIIEYVDGGRNPDIYNREFVELARRSNQLLKGKEEAFGSFTDVFAREMARVMPECREDVERVLEATGRGKLGVEA